MKYCAGFSCRTCSVTSRALIMYFRVTWHAMHLFSRVGASRHLSSRTDWLKILLLLPYNSLVNDDFICGFVLGTAILKFSNVPSGGRTGRLRSVVCPRPQFGVLLVQTGKDFFKLSLDLTLSPSSRGEGLKLTLTCFILLPPLSLTVHNGWLGEANGCPWQSQI